MLKNPVGIPAGFFVSVSECVRDRKQKKASPERCFFFYKRIVLSFYKEL